MQGILHENYYYGQAEVAFGKQRQDGLYRETVLKKKSKTKSCINLYVVMEYTVKKFEDPLTLKICASKKI